MSYFVISFLVFFNSFSFAKPLHIMPGEILIAGKSAIQTCQVNSAKSNLDGILKLQLLAFLSEQKNTMLQANSRLRDGDYSENISISSRSFIASPAVSYKNLRVDNIDYRCIYFFTAR